MGKKGSLVRDLQKKREDEMRRFVDSQDDAIRSEESDWVDRQDLASGTTENPLIRRIAPDRQVLNPEEALILIKADSLARGEEKDDTEKTTPEEKEG